MKRIIDGKLYNTETASNVGSWSNDGGWRDFTHMEETLYRKRTGEFFLHGEGGPMTVYAKPWGQNGSRSGESIIPMSEEDARKWAEEHLGVDEYAEIFGMPEE